MNKHWAIFLNPELRPFLPALDILEKLLAGIEMLWPELTFSIDAEFEAEEDLFVALLTQQVFDVVISNEHGDTWGVILETFHDFSERSSAIQRLYSKAQPEILSRLSSWLIALCDRGKKLLGSCSRH